jgi:hypothetical protein
VDIRLTAIGPGRVPPAWRRISISRYRFRTGGSAGGGAGGQAEEDGAEPLRLARTRLLRPRIPERGRHHGRGLRRRLHLTLDHEVEVLEHQLGATFLRPEAPAAACACWAARWRDSRVSVGSGSPPPHSGSPERHTAPMLLGPPLPQRRLPADLPRTRAPPAWSPTT